MRNGREYENEGGRKKSLPTYIHITQPTQKSSVCVVCVSVSWYIMDDQRAYTQTEGGAFGVTLYMGPLCVGEGKPMKVTWLILPVVICLSQRLSHACLSINKLYCETANGSLNQLSFIWFCLTTWITVVILELIHAKRPDFCGRVVFIRYKTNAEQSGCGDS